MSSHKSLFTKTPAKKAKFDNEEKQGDTTLGTENGGASTSVKKPAFNPALLNSAFYTGPISYGGAGISGNISPYNQYRTSKFYDKKKIDIKVIPSTSNNTVGQIAKTICECLESYSSPVSDAKRVPVNSRPPFSSQGRTFSNLSIFDTSRRSLLNDSLTPSRPHRSRELQIPSIAALSKIKKTNRCSNARAAILASMSSSMPCEPKLYKVRTEDDNNTYKNKIKTKINTVRGVRNEEEELARPVHLQNISLNITSLPTFSESAFSATSSTKYSAPEKKNSPLPVTIASAENNFKFSSPVPARGVETSKSFSKFKFSEPVDIFNPSQVEKLSKDESVSTTSFGTESGSPVSSGLKFSKPDTPSSVFTNFKAGDKFTPIPKEKVSEMWNGIDSNKKNSEKPSLVNGDVPHSSAGKRSHSDLDVVTVDSDENANIKKVKGDPLKDTNLDSFIKKQQQQWECSSCMTRNDQSKDKCACCEALRPGASVSKPVTSPQSAAFGSFIKKQLEQWECPSCMTRNEQSKDKCACCEAAKPGAPAKPNNASPFFKNLISKQLQQWECPGCMIRNDQSKDKCACCEAPKPGGAPASTAATFTAPVSSPATSGFGNLIKKQQEQWECSCCMTRNEQNRNKCVCCEASKPGSESTKAAAANFNFGNPQNTFKFGIDKADSAKTSVADTKLSEVKPLPAAPVSGFTFGSQTSTDNKTANGNIGGFKFGVPSAAATTAESSTTPKSTFSFADKKESTITTPAAGFSFGIKPAEKPTATSISSTVDPKPSGFTFGVVSKDSEPKKDIVSITPKKEEKIVNNAQPQNAEIPKSTTSGVAPSDSKPMFSFTSKPFQFGSAAPATATTSSDTFTPTKPFTFDAKSDSTPKSSFQLPTSSTGSLFPSASAAPKQEADNKAPSALPGVQFTANASAEKPKDQPPPPYFTFGSAATSAPSSNTFKSPVSNTPAFTFGSTAASKPEGGNLFNVPTTTSAPTSLFGAANASSDQGAAATSTLFKPQTTTTPTFGSAATNMFKSANSQFGSSTLNQTATKPPAVLFGGSSLNSEQSTNQPAQSTSPFASPSVPAFGSGNIFGSAASSTAVSPFGATLNKPAESSNNLFNVPPPAAPIFSPSSAASPQTTNPIFGSSPAVPTPVFGASIPFGETSQNQSQQSVSFKFGAPSSTQPPAMGFGQAPAAGSSAPVFSFGSGSPAPLSNSQYNFSMGTLSDFRAAPNMTGPRKFKKAVRRSNVR